MAFASRMGGTVAVAAIALTATPAAAGWRDFMGKTMIVELESVTRTENDTIEAGGGASDNDDVYNSRCTFTYHIYVSSRARLFMHTPRMKCEGSDPYAVDKVTGVMFDLTQPSGVMDSGDPQFAFPYTLEERGDELVQKLPQEDYTYRSDGSVMTNSRSSGSYEYRIRFAPDCSLTGSGEVSYRMEYRSTTSDYMQVQDVHSSGTYSAISCRVVDGFQAK